MTNGNMGFWDKITNNHRQFDDEMRMQWREPIVTDVDPIAGQQDVTHRRISPSSVAWHGRPVKNWKRVRHM